VIAVITYESVRSKSDWEPLIAALRVELQEFGGLIRLLNDEQDAILSKANQIAVASESIARQQALAQMSTRIRNGLMVLPGLGDERRAAPAPEIIEAAPDEFQPLLGALFSEVEKLSLRACVRAQQNDWLRKRAPILAATMAVRADTDAG
jgi:hypothetical protein